MGLLQNKISVLVHAENIIVEMLSDCCVIHAIIAIDYMFCGLMKLYHKLDIVKVLGYASYFDNVQPVL